MSSYTQRPEGPYPRPLTPQPTQPFPETPSPFIRTHSQLSYISTSSSSSLYRRHQQHLRSSHTPSSSTSSSNKTKSTSQTGYDYWSQKLAEQQAEDEQIQESGVEDPFADPINTNPFAEPLLRLRSESIRYFSRNAPYHLVSSSARVATRPTSSSRDSVERKRLAYEHKPSRSSKSSSDFDFNLATRAKTDPLPFQSKSRVPFSFNSISNSEKQNRMSNSIPIPCTSESSRKRQINNQQVAKDMESPKGGKDTLRNYTIKVLSLGLFGGRKKGVRREMESRDPHDARESRISRSSPTSRIYPNSRNYHDDDEHEGEYDSLLSAEKQKQKQKQKQKKAETWTSILSARLSSSSSSNNNTIKNNSSNSKIKSRIRSKPILTSRPISSTSGESGREPFVTPSTQRQNRSGDQESEMIRYQHAKEGREIVRLQEEADKRELEIQKERERERERMWYRGEIERLKDESKRARDEGERKMIQVEMMGMRLGLGALG